MKKQRSASPSHAIPRSARSSTNLGAWMNASVLRQQRVGLVVGEGPVGRPVRGDEIEPEPLQQRADHRARHAVAAVDDDAQRLDCGRVDERPARGRLEARRWDVDLLERCPSARWAPAPECRSRSAAGCPGCLSSPESARSAPRAHELGAGVRLRVVRGGAHQAAVEVARAVEQVEHLGADLAGVEHVDALVHEAGAVAGNQFRAVRRSRGPGPTRSSPTGVPDRLAEHVRECAADQLGRVAVDVAGRRGRRMS